MPGKTKKTDNSAAPAPAPAPAKETPVTDALSSMVGGKIGTAAEVLKNNKGLAGLFLRKSPLGMLAGTLLTTEQGQKLADMAIDKAAGVAEGAFETATKLAQKAETALRDKAAGKTDDAAPATPKKGKDQGPKAP